MVWDIPAHVITDARDLSKNSGNPAFAHPNLCPVMSSTIINIFTLTVRGSTLVVRIRKYWKG